MPFAPVCEETFLYSIHLECPRARIGQCWMEGERLLRRRVDFPCDRPWFNRYPAGQPSPDRSDRAGLMS